MLQCFPESDSLSPAHKATVMCVKWNHNGNWLTRAARDHLIKIFNIRTDVNIKDNIGYVAGGIGAVFGVLKIVAILVSFGLIYCIWNSEKESEGGLLDNENAGGNLRTNSLFVVYLAWKDAVTGIPFDNAYCKDVEPSRGHWNHRTATEVIQCIAHFLHGSKHRWIGITSAGEEGIHCRWNEKYRELGMVHIAWVYSTDSDQYCRDAESDLTHHFHLKSETDEEGSFKLDNDRHGGGGNLGE
ncbi:hypothetical protein EMCRGX_G009172 [Ephydatia muelleri]